jgi:AcrR family transcriptional regulator
MADAGPATARGQRTRAALVHAAARIFERDGFLDARISDIAADAGVASGSFYTYFDSKDAIFREVVDELIEELYRQSHVGDVAGPDPVARIAAANRLYVEAFARHAALYAVVVQVATFNPELRQHRQTSRLAFVDRAARGLRHLQESGHADPGLDADLVAAMLCGMVENFAEVRHLLGQRFDDDQAVAAMTEIWVRAIGLRAEA